MGLLAGVVWCGEPPWTLNRKFDDDVCVLPSYFSYIRLLTGVVLLLCWWTCARGAQAGADEAITELVAKADA